jgi:hypothetical protein
VTSTSSSEPISGGQGPAFGPLPAGSLVTGTIRLFAIRSQCRGHIWQIGQAVPSNWSTGSGFVQPGTCLVCNYTTAPMDAEWWQELATPLDIIGCATAVMAEITRLRKVYDSLHALARAGVADDGMMNFE